MTYVNGHSCTLIDLYVDLYPDMYAFSQDPDLIFCSSIKIESMAVGIWLMELRYFIDLISQGYPRNKRVMCCILRRFDI